MTSKLYLWFILRLCVLGTLMAKKEVMMKMIPVGVVLDLNSSIGSMANRCIQMAHNDFYQLHPHYQTRLHLLNRDSHSDVVQAASAAFDLIMKEKVHAIIGPQTSGQARFIIELGRKFHVPIVSFSATSPSLSLSPNNSPLSQFFIRTAQDDSSQVKAIAAIIEAYGWRQIILIYEDTEYGNGLIPYLTDALEAVNTRVPHRTVIHPNSSESQILKELNFLKNQKNLPRIYVVHMTSHVGSRFFVAAKNAGMMTEGFAWIVTEGLSSRLVPVGGEVMDSMQGVLGVRPMMNYTKKLTTFEKNWKSMSTSHPLTFFGLWAYDTVWALAMAVEEFHHNSGGNVRLVDVILGTKFEGLSGYFNLTEGQLRQSELEIFNVVGHKERVIGYWSSKENVKLRLKLPIWPGDTIEQPTKLRIGVPVRKGFTEFLKVERQGQNGTFEFSGFAIDLFLEVIKVLPFPLPFEFQPFPNNGDSAGSYDDLIHFVANKTYDAAVGDITIVANRSKYVDFTLPYSESGVSMVVSMKHDERQNMWIFLKPLSWSLWLTTGAEFILTGFIIWLLERRTNNEFQGSPLQQLTMMLWFSFSTLVFAHKERLENNWSRLVLTIWIFVVLIITQSYTASLASMLTVQRLQPTFIDVKEIKEKGYCVGHMSGSFVKGFLEDHLRFNEAKLKAYNTPEEYHHALSNGEVAAIFDEIPYVKVFLSKYGSKKYAMVGPTYKTDGFGFALPQKSPLLSYFSRAILNVTEDNEKFEGIKKKYFSSTSEDQSDESSFSSDSPSLTVYSFAGLFIITGVTSTISLLFYVFSFLYSQRSTLRAIHAQERSLWSVLAQMAKHFDRKDHNNNASSSLPPNRSNSRVYPAPDNTASHDNNANNIDVDPIQQHVDHATDQHIAH